MPIRNGPRNAMIKAINVGSVKKSAYFLRAFCISASPVEKGGSGE
jgi:hypothetical protein